MNVTQRARQLVDRADLTDYEWLLLQEIIESAENTAYNRAIEDAASVARSHDGFTGFEIAEVVEKLKKEIA